MKIIIALVLGVALAIQVAAYTTKYDNIDIDEILTNDRLYKKYFDCLTGEGKCTPDGKELKEAIPDALATKCDKCNEKQKAATEKVLKYLSDNKKEDLTRLRDIYDPEGKFSAMYKDEAEKKGIAV
uniref:Chemosensory protein 3 n=1 Tax=Tropidothorax elegans TaxID=2233830 RepID=A0A2Z5EM79_9HEMI|nr:chemosensory protein 3 [Tropidothorax elegans]